MQSSCAVRPLKPYVSADLSRHPALICERSVISPEPRNISLRFFALVFSGSLSPSCSQIFDSCSNCHNYVLPSLPSVNDCMFNQVELFFSPPLPGLISDITKETRAIRSHIDIIFPRYWMRTNTDVSLIRFRQMSCFMRHRIPSVTWNNRILPPWIMALRWLIFADSHAFLAVTAPSSQSEAATPSDSSQIKLSVMCVHSLHLKYIHCTCVK